MTSAAPDDRGAPLLSTPVSGALVARRALQGALLHGLLKLRGLVVLPVLSRALGPSALGVVSLGAALCGMLTPLLTLGVAHGASLLLPGVRERGALARAFSTTALFALSAATLGSVLVFAGLSARELRPAALDALAPHAAPLVLWLFIASLRELATLPLSLRQETGYLVRLNVLVEYGGALLAIVAALRGGGPGAVFLAFAAGLAIGVVPALVRSWRLCGFAPGLEGASLRAGLGNGLPFLAIALGQWALQSLDTLFLAALHGESAVGIYGVSYTIASAALLVLAVINFVLFPTAVSLLREGREALPAFFETSFRLATLALGLGLAEACLLGPWLVELLAGEPYREAGRILPLIVLAYATFTYMLLLQYVPMVVTRRSLPAAAVYLPAVALNATLNVLLIPRFALLGAAAATAVSYAAAAFLMGRLARRVLPIFDCWAPLRRCAPVLALSAAAALAAALARDAPSWQAAGAGLTLAGMYVLLARISCALKPSDWRHLARPC